MRRRMMALALILLVVLVFAGCSKGPKTGKYISDNEQAWVILYDDGTFLFCRHASLNYVPVGEYRVDGNTLTLHAGPAETYRFTIDGDTLIFEEGVLVGGLVSKGMVFTWTKEAVE